MAFVISIDEQQIHVASPDQECLLDKSNQLVRVEEVTSLTQLIKYLGQSLSIEEELLNIIETYVYERDVDETPRVFVNDPLWRERMMLRVRNDSVVWTFVDENDETILLRD
jgi:hypothetical protein